ncbi:RNA polymerase sigma factor [Pengzhenrongella sicca]|uniref:Sigma-70 family RNA polymerase sigma factor n=1 Tax=Pengzhenrongella sicca TaxID=2819238 RepID=A0A8A4ZAR6_9MICO|nr:sigma-70 family RNA polymerase sigma factor [Pengzhenrongella sicca]QTE28515.1 sigma-70 family RNA polymerase sigma factor [Pengzhenrongella sicca]
MGGSSGDIGAAVAEAHRREWAWVLASTARLTRDLGLAEDCTQEAFAEALRTWPTTGVPDRPGAWLTTVARHRALDALRREALFRRTLPRLVMEDVVSDPGDTDPAPDVADDRLRLIFTCCHPALSREAQVALTLRLLCGLSTAEVARAFLVQESTMAARITRAKRKIATARIPYRMPSADELPRRVGAALDVLHLVFTTGHTAPMGADLVRSDLTDSALRLARLLHRLLPQETEATALVALMLLTDARRASRVSASGELVLLADQDRSRWHRDEITEGVSLLLGLLEQRPPGRYAVQAALAAVHAEAPTWESTDWAEVVGLYEVLRGIWPSPVVELNRAVAVGMRDGPVAGLAALDLLLDEPALASYGYLSAARGDLLRRLERWDDAASSYEEALLLIDNDVERAFLLRRVDEVQARRS